MLPISLSLLPTRCKMSKIARRRNEFRTTICVSHTMYIFLFLLGSLVTSYFIMANVFSSANTTSPTACHVYEYMHEYSRTDPRVCVPLYAGSGSRGDMDQPTFAEEILPVLQLQAATEPFPSIRFTANASDPLLRFRRQATTEEAKKEESFEKELCKDKDAGEWFRLVAGEGDNCRDVIQCTSSVSLHIRNNPFSQINVCDTWWHLVFNLSQRKI